jgi:hypothetical protein
VLGTALLAAGLLLRRLGGRPVLWVRQATLRGRSGNDPAERLVALLLRLLAREVRLHEVPALAGGDGRSSMADLLSTEYRDGGGP